MRTTEATNRLTIVVLDQPSSLPRTRAKTSRKRLRENVTKPTQSMRRVLGSRDSAILVSVMTMATTPMGTLTKKIHRHPMAAGDGAADQRTDGHRAAGHRAEDAEGGTPVLALKGLGDQGQGGGEHDGATDPLDAPGQVEHERVGGEATDQRGQGEHAKPDGEDDAAPEHVAHHAGGEEERRQRQGVGVDHPLQVRRSSNCSECWMSGSATFTTVMSSSSMKMAMQTAIRVHHLRSSVGICGVYRGPVRRPYTGA